MKKSLSFIVTIASLCILALTACSHRKPSDAQWTMLLHIERANAADMNAALDADAVNCLRASSNDVELTAGLSAGLTSVEGKRTCRGRLDGLLADSKRNPDKFSFTEITDPKAVREAIALQRARQLAKLDTLGTRPPPVAFVPPAAPSPPPIPDSNVDLGAAGASLQQAEALCTQVQQKAASATSASSLTRFAAFCSGNLRKTRTNMEAFARANNTEKVQALGISADNIANNARKILASAGAN